MKDTLYAKSQNIVNSFQFDDEVARVFTDMITRSVPGYTTMLDILGVLSETKVQNNSHCYDVGCSLGASTLAIRQNIQANNVHLIGIDNSKAMIERCQQVIEHDDSTTPIELICQDVLNIDFKMMSLCSMNLTLQFIPIEQRLPLLQKIASNTLDNGVLFLSEKLQFTGNTEQQELTDLHHQFKKHQGYSDLEIAQKRSAIEHVLIPETLDVHRERLLNAGYSKVYKVLQCFNFVSLIAIK